MRPVLLSLGGYEILAAPVFAGLAAMAAAWFVWRRKAHAKLSADSYWDLMLPLAVGTVLGAVFLYIAFYGGGPDKSLARLARTFRVSGGTFYGNLFGALAAAAAFCAWKGLSFRRVGDLVGGAAPLALTVMRLGCLQHGCCHGRPTDLPWGLVYTLERGAVKRAWLGTPLHPSQLYEALACAGLFAFLAGWVLPRAEDGRLPAGSVLLGFLGSYGVLRFLLEFTRGGDLGTFRPLGLTTAQAFSVLVVLGAGALWTRWSREPG